MKADERYAYLGSIPHSQRSILLLSAAMVVLHPKGSDIVQEVRRHHPGLDDEQLCIHILLDVMISIAGKWNAGSTVLLPVATLIEQMVEKAMDDTVAVCPLSLAEGMWAMIERLHEQPDMALSEIITVPSCN